MTKTLISALMVIAMVPALMPCIAFAGEDGSGSAYTGSAESSAPAGTMMVTGQIDPAYAEDPDAAMYPWYTGDPNAEMYQWYMENPDAEMYQWYMENPDAVMYPSSMEDIADPDAAEGSEDSDTVMYPAYMEDQENSGIAPESEDPEDPVYAMETEETEDPADSAEPVDMTDIEDPVETEDPANTEEILQDTEEALTDTEEALPDTEEALPDTEEALPGTEEVLMDTGEAGYEMDPVETEEFVTSEEDEDMEESEASEEDGDTEESETSEEDEVTEGSEVILEAEEPVEADEMSDTVIIEDTVESASLEEMANPDKMAQEELEVQLDPVKKNSKAKKKTADSSEETARTPASQITLFGQTSQEEGATDVTKPFILELPGLIMESDDIADLTAGLKNIVRERRAAIGSWSLVDLIAVIIASFISILMIVLWIISSRGNEYDEETGDTDNSLFLRTLGLIPAALAIMTFSLTQDLSQQMCIAGPRTVTTLIFLAAEILIVIIVGRAARKTSFV